METGRITEVISTTSYLPETPKTHPTDETTGINYSTEHLDRTTRVFYDDDDETGEEIRNPTHETMNLLRMTELRLLEHELQEVKNDLDNLYEGMYSYSADRDTYNREYNETSDRKDELKIKVNALRRSISAYLPTD
jgi:chromosome segregation ATPase